ncbi:MAG: hypothetical protein KIH10_05215 [Candidatus Freyarchaeota archaeon]|nr:hypothetical protein [Candidatus Jordarchaeia archaeon]MBS7279324.1 hypothetical protein [Candidatus Jordarchaeia archaeon]
MGRTGSTYRARLTLILNACLEVYTQRGVVDVSSLAEKVDLTERAVKDYLDDLSNLDILTYEGAGRYRVNVERIDDVTSELLFEPKSSILVEDFVGQNVAAQAELITVSDKVRRLLEKLDFPKILGTEVREKLCKTRVEETEYLDHLLGETMVLPKFARDLFLDNVYVCGSASAHKLEHWALFDFSLLSVVALSSGAYLGFFDKNILDQGKSLSRYIPDLHSYRGIEPFEEGEPFFEMSTDFPELLEAGRSIAARYLREIQHYRLGIEILEEHGDKFQVYFKLGSLSPHGFMVYSRELVRLRDRCHELYYKFLESAKKCGVVPVGVVPISMDNFFFKMVRGILSQDLGSTNDLNFLSMVLEDGDSTCLIKRGHEKDKPPTEDNYEFYVMKKPFVTKYEFVSKNPLEDQKRIADLAFSLSSIPLKSRFEGGPSVVSSAKNVAMVNLEQLMRAVKGSIKTGLMGLWDELQRTRDLKRLKNAGRKKTNAKENPKQ